MVSALEDEKGMGGSVPGQHKQERAMADVLDQLQEQEDLINRLHIQAVRQQLNVKALPGVNAVETVFRNGVKKRYPAYVPALSVSGYWKFREKITRGEQWKAEKPM